MQTSQFSRSYTGRAGNTWQVQGGSAQNGNGQSVKGARVSFDRGSDGSIDAAAGGLVASGPTRTFAAGGAAGPNGARAGVVFSGPNVLSGTFSATNYETSRVWSSYTSK